MVQTAPRNSRQPVAWAGMQGTRVALRRPANDNRRPRRMRPGLLIAGAAMAAAGVAALLLLT